MPGLDGIGVLRALRRADSPIPVVVVSAFSPLHGARAVDALAEGAVELVVKPGSGTSPDHFYEDLVAKVRLAARSRRGTGRPGTARAPAAPARSVSSGAATRRAVVIACSTGGPRALADLVPRLPAPLGTGTLIVQHMPAGFTRSLAERLDRASKLSVREAEGAERLDSAVALVAPGGSHLRLRDDGTVYLSDEAPVGGLKPRADLTIADAARVFGSKLLLVVLTGMGKDGLEGAREVKKRGGRILVEAEETCTVYGMPRAVAEASLADSVLPLDELPGAIAREAA
jgi:two-component system chemotaxis response regulator CheB